MLYIPKGFFFTLQSSKLTTTYLAEPFPTGFREPWQRGRVLGGSTAVEISVGGKPLRRRSTETLMERLRAVIRERGESIASQGREITSALRVQGELLLATTNVRLQWVVLALTLLVGAAGIYATISAS